MNHTVSQAILHAAILVSASAAYASDLPELKVTETGNKIILLPGMTGGKVGVAEMAVNDWGPNERWPGLKGRAQAETIDWTRCHTVEGTPLFGLFTGLNLIAVVQRMTRNVDTTDCARAIALNLLEWREQQDKRDKELGRGKTCAYILAGSAGTMMAKLVCEAEYKDKAKKGKRILPDCFFERIVFISSALPTDSSLEDVGRCSKDGLYNYFSSLDDVLEAAEAVEKTKSAAGHLGYEHSDQFKYVHGQLSHSAAASLGNDGKHMHAAEINDYFTHYFIGLLQPLDLNKLPDAWVDNSKWKPCCSVK